MLPETEIHTWPERGYAAWCLSSSMPDDDMLMLLAKVVDVVSCKALQLITRNAMEMEARWSRKPA